MKECMNEWMNEWVNGWKGPVWCFKGGFFWYCYLTRLPPPPLYVPFPPFCFIFSSESLLLSIGGMIHFLVSLIVFFTWTRASGWRKVSPTFRSYRKSLQQWRCTDSEFQRETRSTNEIDEEASRGQSNASHERVSGVDATCPHLARVSRRLPKGGGISVSISKTGKKA